MYGDNLPANAQLFKVMFFTEVEIAILWLCKSFSLVFGLGREGFLVM
jgi:hypothetical protein